MPLKLLNGSIRPGVYANAMSWNRFRCLYSLWDGQKSDFLGRQRLHQTVRTDDFHDPFHVVGEHIQTHHRTHPGQLSRQEVRRTHPLFERPEEQNMVGTE